MTYGDPPGITCGDFLKSTPPPATTATPDRGCYEDCRGFGGDKDSCANQCGFSTPPPRDTTIPTITRTLTPSTTNAPVTQDSTIKDKICKEYGVCDTPKPTASLAQGAICGNGKCEVGESAFSCSADCGKKPDVTITPVPNMGCYEDCRGFGGDKDSCANQCGFSTPPPRDTTIPTITRTLTPSTTLSPASCISFCQGDIQCIALCNNPTVIISQAPTYDACRDSGMSLSGCNIYVNYPTPTPVAILTVTPVEKEGKKNVPPRTQCGGATTIDCDTDCKYPSYRGNSGATYCGEAPVVTKPPLADNSECKWWMSGLFENGCGKCAGQLSYRGSDGKDYCGSAPTTTPVPDKALSDADKNKAIEQAKYTACVTLRGENACTKPEWMLTPTEKPITSGITPTVTAAPTQREKAYDGGSGKKCGYYFWNNPWCGNCSKGSHYENGVGVCGPAPATTPAPVTPAPVAEKPKDAPVPALTGSVSEEYGRCLLYGRTDCDKYKTLSQTTAPSPTISARICQEFPELCVSPVTTTIQGAPTLPTGPTKPAAGGAGSTGALGVGGGTGGTGVTPKT
ncbi:MAG: hypothetical protein AAB508_04310, partial [Patescibacteria group bacterium]